MASMNVKTGDLVEVIVGKVGDKKANQQKGRRGKIMSVDPADHTVIVEGVNMCKRHSKPRGAKQQGGIVNKARSIDVSNVMVVCPKCSKATRVGHTLAEDGKKYVRCCKKCGAIIDVKQAKAAKAAVKKTTKKASAKKAEIKEEE